MLIQQDTSRFVKYIATLEDWNISIEYKTMMIDEYWYPIKRHHVNVLELIYQKDYFLIYVSHIKKTVWTLITLERECWTDIQYFGENKKQMTI